MNTDSNSTRAIDRNQTNTFFLAVLVLTIAFATGCSISLVDKTPEVLRYCRVAERSEPSDQAEVAGQASSRPVDHANAACIAADDESCADDAVDRASRGQQVNCGL